MICCFPLLPLLQCAPAAAARVKGGRQESWDRQAGTQRIMYSQSQARTPTQAAEAAARFMVIR